MDTLVAKHLQGVSRTYAILIPLLPAPLADAVGLAYLLMRIVDTLEDDPHLSAEQRRRFLELLDIALDNDERARTALARPLGNTPDERALMAAAPQVLTRLASLPPEYREPIQNCARAMSAGVRRLMARSAERAQPYPAIRDAAELREYCYYVAGVVGEMLCAMMADFLRLPALRRLSAVAVELGIGLQLVNILKDALKDSEQGRRYLPLASDGGAGHGEIYKAALHEARQSLQRGIEFVLALPAAAAGLRSFCGLPIAWGAMTLARAERNAARAKIGVATVRASIARFARLAGDDQALRQWLSSLLWPRRGLKHVAAGQLA